MSQNKKNVLRVINHSYGGYIFITPSNRAFIWDTGHLERTKKWLLPLISPLERCRYSKLA
ncbi:MAG: hypothetical protein GX974_04595 [Clostridiales bacterium]|nr:hypothetical protein [Clostridiales bacterium]